MIFRSQKLYSDKGAVSPILGEHIHEDRVRDLVLVAGPGVHFGYKWGLPSYVEERKKIISFSLSSNPPLPFISIDLLLSSYPFIIVILNL